MHVQSGTVQVQYGFRFKTAHSRTVVLSTLSRSMYEETDGECVCEREREYVKGREREVRYPSDC